MLLSTKIFRIKIINSISRETCILSKTILNNQRRLSCYPLYKNFTGQKKERNNLALRNKCHVRCSLPTKRLKIIQKKDFSNSCMNYSNGGKEKVQEVQTSKWLTIPNALTVMRMGISPYIGYLVLSENYSLALGLVIVSAATDSVDGWIARNFKGQSSIIGSYIDPLADKIFISILILTLTMVKAIPVSLCGMIILRDILLVATSSHFHYKSLEPPRTLEKFFDFENSPVKMEPTQISKYNSFLQFGLVTFSLMAPVFNFVDHPFLQAYWYLVGTTTVISGLSYVVKDKSAYKRFK